MILSRSKPAASETNRQSLRQKDIPKHEKFLQMRDYSGALTLIAFNVPKNNAIDSELWIAYCEFHLGNYKRAAMIYEKFLKKNDNNLLNTSTHLACCYFFLGMYSEAKSILHNAYESSLKNRLLFHLSHKMENGRELYKYHDKLLDVIEDQLCLASIHYLRAHYQEAIDIYKKILLDNRDYLALNVYVALCYYKLDYYDVAQEVLQVYLQKYPDSAISINLKACNHFRLYDGNAAQAELRQLVETTSSYSFGHDLIRHNSVVFKEGDGALKVFPNLIDIIPEARLNLVIYYLKQNDVQEAFELMKDLEPSVPQEYILKGTVDTIIGQETGSRESIKTAQQYFHLVGSSTSECDTIPGRHCMSACLFLRRQFDEVLVYLNSIKTYFSSDDRFNFNYGQAQAASGLFKGAEDAFLIIRNERLKKDFTYTSVLAYCYIMNKKSQQAWELFLKMDTSSQSFNLLQIIANTCYTIGEFWYAAKAFDMLNKLDPSPEYWEGKRGACCGTFQYIVAQKKSKDLLPEVIQLLRNTSNSQVDQIIRVMKKWGKDNRIPY